MNDHTSASVSILGMSKTTTADAIVTALGGTRSVARDIALIAWSTQSGHVAFDLPHQHHMAAVLAVQLVQEIVRYLKVVMRTIYFVVECVMKPTSMMLGLWFGEQKVWGTLGMGGYMRFTETYKCSMQI
jgi:hypothetical protein